MRLLRLQLADYRNFHRLDLSLGPGASVFIGANAQGKTNLLESIYLLATMKELRAESEAQVIRREVAADPIPAARVVGEGETAAGPLKVEVAVVGREGGSGLIASKTTKVNGVPKRLSDAVGRLTAVLFTAADIDLICGAPRYRSWRRWRRRPTPRSLRRRSCAWSTGRAWRGRRPRACATLTAPPPPTAKRCAAASPATSPPA